MKTKLAMLSLSVIFLIFAYFLSIPAQPLFYKLFVPFPKLEAATVYTGTLEVIGEERCRKGSCAPPTYYVVNETGKHEIYWWLPGDRLNRYSRNWANGATGTFWVHPDFGVMQEDITFHKNGLNPGDLDNVRKFHSYSENKVWFEKHFDYNPYFWKLLPSVAFLIAAIFSLVKARRSV